MAQRFVFKVEGQRHFRVVKHDVERYKLWGRRGNDAGPD